MHGSAVKHPKIELSVAFHKSHQRHTTISANMNRLVSALLQQYVDRSEFAVDQFSNNLRLIDDDIGFYIAVPGSRGPQAHKHPAPTCLGGSTLKTANNLLLNLQ